MKWNTLESEDDVNRIVESSFEEGIGVAIFKHSTRCSISSMVKNRLSSSWKYEERLPLYYLDLIRFRAVSNYIASKFEVVHESPQFLLIKDGKCVYHSSHNAVSTDAVEQFLKDIV